MKHLKSFTDDFYQSITREEWHNYESEDRLAFSKREIEAIEKFIFERSKQNEIRIEWNEDYTQLVLNPTFYYINWTCIEKYDDEWYIVWISTEPDQYYKCDQLKGLLELIDMEIN